MNTIVTQMPMADAGGSVVPKSDAGSDGKSSKFDEILKNQSSQKESADTETADKESVNGSGQKEQKPGRAIDENRPFNPEILSALFFKAVQPELAVMARQDVTRLKGTEQNAAVENAGSENVNSAEVLTLDEKPAVAQSAAEPPYIQAADSNKEVPVSQSTQDGLTEKTEQQTAVNFSDQLAADAGRLSAAESVIKETASGPQKSSEQQMYAEAAKGVAPDPSVSSHASAANNVFQAKSTAHAETMRPEYLNYLKSDIVKQVASGKQQFEIQLNPAHLGKIVIKAACEAGRSVVSIVCSEAKTMQVMSRQAGELAQMLESRTGDHTEVVVEKPAEDYLQQQTGQDNAGQNAREQQNDSDSRGGQNEDAGYKESIDFLQHLRLKLA